MHKNGSIASNRLGRGCLRDYHRMEFPLWLTVGGRTLRVKNWSLGGLLVGGALPRMTPRGRVLALLNPCQSCQMAGQEAVLETVRQNAQGTAFRFEPLTPGIVELLTAVMRDSQLQAASA